MALGQLLIVPRLQEVSATGAPLSGALLEVYLAGTTNPATTYSDIELTTPNENPLEADASGRFGAIFVDPSKAYKVVLKTAAGVTVYTQDNITLGLFLPTVLSKTGNYTIQADDGRDVLVLVDATAGNVAITLLSAEDREGYAVRVKKIDDSANTVTITPDGSETIDGEASYVIEDEGAAVELLSDGADWWSMSSAGAVGDTKPFLVFTPAQHQPPSSAYATLDVRNGHLVLDFDGASDEETVFSGVLPPGYRGGGLVCELWVGFTSADSGHARFQAAIERITDSLDIDSDSFEAFQSAGLEAPSTVGVFTKVEITFEDGEEMDSLAAGEAFRLKIRRDADGTSGTDDINTDAELLRVVLREP